MAMVIDRQIAEDKHERGVAAVEVAVGTLSFALELVQGTDAREELERLHDALETWAGVWA